MPVFTKPSIDPNTTKVVFVGVDGRKNTDDDIGVADLARLKRGVQFSKVRGINVITARQIIKNRMIALRNPQAKFRREKDRRAIQAIRSQMRLKRIGAF